MNRYNINQVYTHMADDGYEWICCRVAQESRAMKPMDMTKAPQVTLQSRLLAAADLKLIITERSKDE